MPDQAILDIPGNLNPDDPNYINYKEFMTCLILLTSPIPTEEEL